ncbi:hypothetical protein OHA18_06405 [Kribbella sp. NBC_00709]|uniref:hypothetical protein n=1 Tax=Kribbella sp. NBC_00709 TaxID=2975972 RepID=UPI002E2CEB16|nr:hypothetical protein [Kribbella sp. NBC_00709]
MDWVRRRAGWVLGLGLIGALVWTAAVTLSQPGWYDPTRDCSRKLGGDPSGVHTSWFPPRASCLYGEEARQYMSTTRSVVLSITAVLLLIVVAAGLILTVRRLSGDPGPVRAAGDTDLRKRRITHLGFGALDLAVVFAPLTFLNAMAIVFGGIPGGILFIVASLLGLSAICTALDRHMGPLPSSALDSRRRGTIAGTSLFGVVFAATAVSGQLPFFRLWSVPLAGIAYAVIAAVQWSRATTATLVRHSG